MKKYCWIIMMSNQLHFLHNNFRSPSSHLCWWSACAVGSGILLLFSFPVWQCSCCQLLWCFTVNDKHFHVLFRVCIFTRTDRIKFFCERAAVVFYFLRTFFKIIIFRRVSFLGDQSKANKFEWKKIFFFPKKY